LRGLLLDADDAFFCAGVMNMLWMAVLTAFMVLEKVIDNKWISQVEA